MALPKVGVQVVVQDMAKFTRDMTSVNKTFEKMQDQLDGFANLAWANNMKGLSSVFAGLGTTISASLGPIGLALGVVQALMVVFEKLSAPIKKAWNAIKEFAADMAGKIWEGIKKVGKAIFDFFNPLPEIFDMIKRTASIAFGVLVRDTIRNFGEAIKNLATNALEAASNFQLLEIRLRGLALRDLMEGVDVTETFFRAPTSEERLALINYTDSLAALTTELEATQKAYDESVQSSGAFSKESLELEIKLRGLENQVTATRKTIDTLTLNEDGLIRATRETTVGAMEQEAAMAEAAKQAKELLMWVSRLAIQSPFSTQDVANAFTMAKGFGLTTEMAKASTEAVMNFAAGMGLTGEQMERILINFGQMWTQGKVTGTELRDLARGSLVPVMRIFELLGEKVGKTGVEMKLLASKGKVSVTDFINAFNEMAMTDFPNAAKNMTRTLAGLKEKLKDFGETYFGMFLIKPALDVITGKLSDFFDMFMGNTAFLQAIEALGGAFGRLMEAIFNPKINEDVVTKVTQFLFNLVFLVDALAKKDTESIKEKLLNLGIPEWVIESVENIYNAWKGFWDFFVQIKDTLISGAKQILEALGIKLDTGGLEGFTQWLEDTGTYLSQNAATIAGQIQTIVDNITRFIEIVRTGGLPGGRMAGKEKQLGLDTGTAGLDNIALKIHDIREDIESFSTTVGPMMDKFGMANAEPMERIADAIGRIFGAFGIKKAKKEEGGLWGILDLITSINEATATVLEKIADAIERIMKPEPPGGSFVGKVLPGIRTMWQEAQGVNDEYLNPDNGILTTQVDTFTTEVEKKFKGLSGKLVGHSIIPEMLADISKEFTNFFSPDAILRTIQTWASNVKTEFSNMKTDVYNAVSSLVTDIANKFIGVFSIPEGSTWVAIVTFIQKVIGMFQDMWNEMTQNSIIPDMMDDIEEEMVGGFASTYKKSAGLMDKFLGNMQGSANYARNIPFTSGNNYSNTYYNFDFDANYAQSQSPVMVKHDVEALLTMVAR